LSGQAVYKVSSKIRGDRLTDIHLLFCAMAV
jgi:hypothetical protein